jgi:PAS domain S-box-containing protein
MSLLNPPSYEVSPVAPLVHWPDHGHQEHVVQFYAEDAALLDSISEFIGTALEAEDAAVVIATQLHRDGLSQRLMARGLDVASAIRRGQYIALDASETLSQFMREGSPDAVAFANIVGDVFERARAAANGGRSPCVAAFGEMVALLWARGNPQAALRLEELWNDLAHAQSFSLRCAYPITGFNRDEHGGPFLRICAAHSSVLPDESYTSLPGDAERLRSITHLQQKAQALKTEKADREQAQRSLRRKESELADLLENALEGAQQTGPDQEILWANQAMLKLLGYAPEEYVGHPFMDFYADKNAFDVYWQKLMRGEDICDYSAELRCKDGSIKHVLLHANGLWEDGKFVHTRCFIRDVTAQKLAEQGLRESEANLCLAKDKLESLVDQRTTALRRLSSKILTLQDAERRRIARELHDSLGQYLVGLKLNIDMLRQSPGQNELWAQATEIMEQCISEVRTLSCLLHPPMIDELGLVSSVRWFVDGLGQRSGIRISVDVPGDLPRLPAAIELVLFRVLQEALTNVHRHSGASAAEVLIRQENERVVLEVKDNGRGMQPELLARFDQAGTGMGVGLSGMRERVQELDGRMKLESDNNGTSLRVALPVVLECAVPVVP